MSKTGPLDSEQPTRRKTLDEFCTGLMDDMASSEYEKGRQLRRPRNIPNANCYFSPRLEQYHQVSKSLQPSFLSDPSLHSI